MRERPNRTVSKTVVGPAHRGFESHSLRAWVTGPDGAKVLSGRVCSISSIEELVEAAAVLAFRDTRAQGFNEGNKRTALLLARWLIDRNGGDGGRAPAT